MKRVGTLLALAACLLAPATLQAAKKYEKLKTPPLRPVTMPAVTRVTLDNGLQLFVVEDHDLPLFRMTLTMKAGGAYDPAQKLGLAEITAGVLRTGGSESLSGDSMDEQLESMGGSIESSADELSTTIGVNTLIEDSDKAMAMLGDLLLHPAYPQDKIDLEIKQTKSAITRRNDEPSEIADREMDKVLYGKDHPFARTVEYEHLARIGRQDLLDFHKAYYHPQDAYLAVWGDFDAKPMIESVRAALSGWPKTEVSYPEIPPVPETSPGVHLAVKESVNQSNILMGHRGTTQKDPDYFALVVMNEILGGSFGSRLFNEVRSRQALSYGVFSNLGAGLLYPGMFRVQCGTKSETTVKAAQACKAEVEKMKTKAITQDELQRAKDGILNSHVFNFTNKGAIVNRQITYVRNGYPADFLETFPAKIQAVTVEDVQRAAGKFLQPDKFALLVVGKPADFDEQLSALGTVHEVDISIPEPPMQAEQYPAPTAETRKRADEILAASAKAAGTPEALKKVSNLTETANLTLSMMGQTLPAKMTRYFQYPGNTRMEIEIMGQKIVKVYSMSANSGFQSAGPQSQDFGAEEISDAKEEVAHDLIAIWRDPSAYSAQWVSEAQVNEKPADVLLMSPAGLPKFKIFVDRGSKQIVKMEYRGKSMQGMPVREQLLLGDYKKDGGLVLPHKATVLQDDQQFLVAQTTSFAWTAIPQEKFKKPSS